MNEQKLPTCNDHFVIRQQFSCAVCEKQIVEGEPHWSVSLQREVFKNPDFENQGSVCLHVFCEDCIIHIDQFKTEARALLKHINSKAA